MVVLKVIGIADLHIGNPRINVEALYRKLQKFLYPELDDAHLLVISGDIYDQLLTVNSKAHKFASIIMRELLMISARTGLQIRLLHGTYTHDRDQLSIFETLKYPNSRFKVVDQIDVEEITDLKSGQGNFEGSLKVLYIPDNLAYKRSEDAIEQCTKVLACVGWHHVDMVVGHGTFEHVIPPDSGHRPPCMYRLEQFEKIVPYGPIIMGHIHTPGKRGPVHYCGSFERMSHGEEENKGFYVFSKETKNFWKSKFVVNTLATPFISITPTGADAAATVTDFIGQVDERFPVRVGHVRVIHADPEIRSLLHKICAQHFPDITYSSKSTATKENTALKMDEVTLDVFEDVKPDIHNLGQLVFHYLDENKLLGEATKEDIVSKTETLLPILK